MGSKRRHSSEDGCRQSQTPMKRSRCSLQQTCVVLQDDDSDYQKSPPRQDCGSKKAANIADELANLADYNKPPVTRSRKDSVSQVTNDGLPTTSRHGVNTSRASRSTRQAASLRDKPFVQGARIAKSTTTATRGKKMSFEEKARVEGEKLGRWPGWVSEEENISESDDEEQHAPRSHSRRYPPKVSGTQNIPWTELLGEIRNSIYRYAMTNEEKKVLNVRHYPGGVPRRSVRGIASPTNFAHSYWGLTQTCRQIREEFTPWLLKKRRVRTALETPNDYVNTFHRPNKDSQRTGWVEPICCGAPLPQHGVEVLELLKLQETSPGFHLQLVPTTVSAVLDALNTAADSDDFDGLEIMHNMAETFRDWWHGTVVSSTGLDGIHITSVTKNEKTIAGMNEDVHDSQHEILIKLSINLSKADDMMHEKRFESLNAFIFASELCNKTGVKLEAHLDTGIAIWKVRRIGVVDMRWKAKADGGKLFHRLTQDVDYPGYIEEDLD